MTTAAAGFAAARTSAVTAGATVADPLGVRGDFPAAAEGTYLNTPYIGPPPRQVEEAGIAFIHAKSKAPISLGDMLAKGNEARRKFATLFGTKPEEIAFLFATSEGENIVTAALDLKEGDNVVVDDLHYETTYLLYKTLEKRRGIELRVVPSLDGRADPEHFEPFVDNRTRLVSVSWVSHQNGFRHDLKGLSELAHAHGAYLYVDGIQALGMFDTDLHDEGVDFMTSGTYKWLFASYGIAPFFIREQHLDRIPVDRLGSLSIADELPGYEFRLYETARKYEYATLAFGPLYQLDAALDYLGAVRLERIESHTVGLAQRMRKGLVERGFDVWTPEGNGSAIVTFAHGKDPERAQELFKEEKVALSFRDEGERIRVGVAMFNTGEDVERFLEVTDRLKAM